MKSTYTVKFRRHRQGLTNYRKRLKQLKSLKPRLVIRKSLNSITAQIISHSMLGDKVVLSAYSKELEGLGWSANKGNLPASYLVGLLIGKKAIKNNIKDAILDNGLSSSTKGSRIYAALKGAIDSGLNIPHSKDILPDDNRIKGMHIIEYAKLRNKVSEIDKLFNNVKTKIESL